MGCQYKFSCKAFSFLSLDNSLSCAIIRMNLQLRLYCDDSEILEVNMTKLVFSFDTEDYINEVGVEGIEDVSQLLEEQGYKDAFR